MIASQINAFLHGIFFLDNGCTDHQSSYWYYGYGNYTIMQRPKAIFLNAARLDYDKALSFSRLSNLTDLTLHDVDCIKSSDDIVELVNSSKAEIVVTKEMEVRYIMTSFFISTTA